MAIDVHISEFSTQSGAISGLTVISPRVVTESRGVVRELYRQSAHSGYLEGFAGRWEQINLTATRRGAVRGLHGENMNKLVTVAYGTAFGVYVDTRKDSQSAGNVVTIPLEPGVQVFVPRGVCNGFQATGAEITEYLYFFDAEWMPGMSGVALTPLDPELHIDWPIQIEPKDRNQISEKDANAPTLSRVMKDMA